MTDQNGKPKSTAQKLIESFTPAQLEKSGVYTGKAVVSEDGKHVTIVEEKKFNDR